MKDWIVGLALPLLCVIILFITIGYTLAAEPVNPKVENRYCWAPQDIPRNADKTIHRNSAIIVAFYKAHPCPVNKSTTGHCTGWQVNHVIPLASGGCDAVWNMQWLPVAIKTCTLDTCVDRFERTIYDPAFGKP